MIGLLACMKCNNVQHLTLKAFSIPREVLIVTGEREAVVKALGEGRFQPVEFENGMWRVDKPH